MNQADLNRALWLAAENNLPEEVALLLAVGADSEAKDTGGWTLLHWAAAHGREEIAIRLLTAGADVEARNKDGLTPLHLAAWNGCAKVVLQLLSANADEEYPDRRGKTALDLAQEAKHDVVVAVFAAHAAREVAMRALQSTQILIGR